MLRVYFIRLIAQTKSDNTTHTNTFWPPTNKICMWFPLYMRVHNYRVSNTIECIYCSLQETHAFTLCACTANWLIWTNNLCPGDVDFNVLTTRIRHNNAPSWHETSSRGAWHVSKGGYMLPCALNERKATRVVVLLIAAWILLGSWR